MWIRITPLDVLLFRDSRPFSADDSFRAASVAFPPGPLPFVGAVRSKVLSLALEARGFRFSDYGDACKRPAAAAPALRDLLDRFGTPGELGRLRFQGPFVMHPKRGAGVPRPLDAGRQGGAEAQGTDGPAFLVPKAPRWKTAQARTPKLLPLRSSNDFGEEQEALFLCLEKLEAYLTGTHALFFSADDVVTSEPRTGIKLSPERTAADGHLYTVEYLRLKEEASFLLGVEGLAAGDLPSEGFLQLGGEARAAAYRVLDKRGADVLPRALAPAPKEGKRFKVTLLAPGIHEQGWLPDFVQEQNGAFWADLGGGERAQLVSAAVGKPAHVGGWDLVAGAPRPMLRAAPAGSVYFFEAERELSPEAVERLVARLHWQSTMEPPAGSLRQFYRQAGFGLSVVGSW